MGKEVIPTEIICPGCHRIVPVDIQDNPRKVYGLAVAYCGWCSIKILALKETAFNPFSKQQKSESPKPSPTLVLAESDVKEVNEHAPDSGREKLPYLRTR